MIFRALGFTQGSLYKPCACIAPNHLEQPVLGLVKLMVWHSIDQVFKQIEINAFEIQCEETN